MLSRRYKERPDCQEILADEKSWALSRNELENNFNIRDIANFRDKFDSSFIYKIFVIKIIENTVGEVNELSLFIRDYFYDKEFIEVKPLGKGCYGQVFEVKKRANNDEVYAIKKIEFNWDQEKQFLKELITSSFITKLRNERLALYYDVWLENMTFYIQMELCDEKGLKDVIIEMEKDSDLYKNLSANLTLLGYYIASKIFAEILEGVNYLHKQDIIHRDLKPDNILFKLNADGGNFVKIADFGLVAIHKNADKELYSENKFAESQHTVGIGAGRYAADEKKYGRKYDTRADIYSLGVIAEELFFIDINRFVEILKFYSFLKFHSY
jgi:serine/threonine protein kinase